ncbi:MAG: ABC transporter permease [Phycisphaerae bacterium]|nr:ABC transporter permease [Gemmatimonadaceae bacterium]
MRPLHAAFNWVRHLFMRRRFEREMQGEMEAHIEQQSILNQARGMSARDALAAARREFGNVAYLQEQSRDARGTRLVEETLRDVRYGVRSLLRTPGFTIVALLSLTLGIGVNTSLFTFMRYASAPPVSNPSTFVSAKFFRLTYPTWKALASEPGLFSRSAAQASATVAIARLDRPALEANVHVVSDGFFALYETLPFLGRLLVPGDEQDAGGTPAAVLSYSFWQREYGADSGVVGRTLRLSNGSLFTIVGVTSVQFGGLNLRTPDFWVPLSARLLLPVSAAGAPIDWLRDPLHQWLTFEGRLAPGVSIEQARMRLRSIVHQSGTVDSVLAADMSYRLKSADDNGQSPNVARPRVVFVLAATFMVLLIGCANVANLVLARGVRRRREIAVRLSLGAGRVRLIRQLTTECLILAVAGGVCALVFSTIALRLLATSEYLLRVAGPNAGATLVAQLRLTPASVWFTFGVAFVSAAACGLLPALRSTKMDLSRAARDEGSHLGHRLKGSKLRAALVGGQVAFSLLLLTITSVLGRSAINAGVLDTGFDRAHLAISQIGKSQTGYSDAQMQVFADGYATRLAALVGDSNVARGTIPMTAVSRIRVNPKLAGMNPLHNRPNPCILPNRAGK